MEIDRTYRSYKESFFLILNLFHVFSLFLVFSFNHLKFLKQLEMLYMYMILYKFVQTKIKNKELYHFPEEYQPQIKGFVVTLRIKR